MAFMAPIFSIFSAFATVAGGMASAGAQQQAGEAQAGAYYYNAQIQQQNANAVRDAAYADKIQQDRKNRFELAKIRSKYLASGVELEGTPGDVLLEETGQMALESAKIMHKGNVEATNYINQANMSIYQGNQTIAAAEAQADSTRTSALMGGISGLGRSLFSGGMF